jgi:hypothetical protein
VAEEMGRRGFSWRQTTVAKSESATRPVLFTEVVAIAEVLGKPIGFFLKTPDALEAVVERSAKRVQVVQGRIGHLEAQLAMSKYDLECEECVNQVALSAKEYRDTYDSGVLRHQVDSIYERFGAGVIRFNDAYEAIPISRHELEAIDREALTAVTKMMLHVASGLSEEEIKEDGAELLNGASDYLNSIEVDPAILDSFRTVEQWGDMVCSRIVDLFVERISR